MKTYILTEKEREHIKAYLDCGDKNPQLRNIKHRAKMSLKQIEEDLALVKRYLAAAGVA